MDLDNSGSYRSLEIRREDLPSVAIQVMVR